MMNHLPTIPPSADNDEVNKRNLKLLNNELEKPKRSNEVMKILMTHTYPFKNINHFQTYYSYMLVKPTHYLRTLTT